MGEGERTPWTGVSVTSSGSGAAAGRDVNSAGVTINANVGGRPEHDMALQADRYEQKIAEIIRLTSEVERLSGELGTLQQGHRQSADRHAQHCEQQARAHAEAMTRVTERATLAERSHAEAMVRVTERATAVERSAAEQIDRLRRRVKDLESDRARRFWRGMLLALGPHRWSGSTRIPVVGVLAGLVVGGLGAGAAMALRDGRSAAVMYTPGPVRTVTAAGPSTTPVDLPCQAGMWAVRFASLTDGDGADTASGLDEHLRLRLDELANRAADRGLDLDLEVTEPGQQICPGLQLSDSRPAERTYIFSGPMSRSEAIGVCTRLDYGIHDCIRVSLSPPG